MKKVLLSSFVAVVAAAVMLVTALPSAGQPPAGKGKGVGVGGGKGGGGGAKGKGGGGGGPNGVDGPYYQAPEMIGGPPKRNSEGKPDMSGFWTARMGRAIFDVTSAIVEPADKKIPYTAEAAARAKDLKANHMFDETEAHCFQSGVPHTAYQQFGYQIVHVPGYVAFMPEYAHSYRLVPTDNRPHIPADVKLFMGDGVGHWDGDTLVVETTNQNGVVWLDMEGNFTSDKIHVVERFTMVDLNQINYEATITDPNLYTQPWKIAGNLGRHDDPTYEIMEFACHEGNIDLEHYPEAVGGTVKLDK